MAAEVPRRRELTELVADHLLRDEHGHVLAAVVDGDRVTDHLGEDGSGARPRAEHLLRARRVHLLDLLEQPFFHERPLLAGSAHRISLPRLGPLTINFSDSLTSIRVRLPSFG